MTTPTRAEVEALTTRLERYAAWADANGEKGGCGDESEAAAALRALMARVEDLDEEIELARLALGCHRSNDTANDEGCGCTMAGIVYLCESEHATCKQLDARLRAALAAAEPKEPRP